MTAATITVPVVKPPDLPAMATDALLQARTSLPRRADAVRAARHWLANTLAAWDVPDDDTDNAVLLLDEIYTNAVIHACGDAATIEITVALWGASLKVGVEDPDSNTAIETPSPRDSAEHGRGLLIVQALAHRFGAGRTPRGKQIWFELFTGGDTR